jgi:putative oxidoreductase
MDMATIARCLIAFFFVASGAGKIFAFRPSSAILASIGFPIPTFFVTAFIAVEIAGGLGLFLNLWTGYVAVALILFLIFATVTVHGPLVRDPVTGSDQVVHIIKNIAIIGGLLPFVAF